MHLISKKRRNKKKYDKVFIYMYDGDMFEFDLGAWDIYRDQDWIEVIKKDELEMNSYVVGNILRVRFISIPEVTMTIVKDSSIMPIPSTVA